MVRTLSSNVRETPGEVRDTKLMGESSGPVLIIGAGKVTVDLLWEIGNGEDWCRANCSQFWQSPRCR